MMEGNDTATTADGSGLDEPRTPHPVVGALTGEGVGPEVIGSALHVLEALEAAFDIHFDVRFGGPIGLEAERLGGAALTEDVVTFCSSVFADGGGVLAGAGGGRFVYDLRRRLDLFAKLSPIRPRPELAGAGRLLQTSTEGVDILVVRETTSGIYQGSWALTRENGGGSRATHSFETTDEQARRVVRVAMAEACRRREKVALVVKRHGLPSMSELWEDVARFEAAQAGVALSVLDIDHAAYVLVQHAHELDVLMAPNLFGDVLSDLGAVLLGSRGLSFGATYGEGGTAVYQTNHGSATDIAGDDIANPVGQILALGWLLERTLGLPACANAVEHAVTSVFRAGYRPRDLAEPGCHIVGTRELTARIADAVLRDPALA